MTCHYDAVLATANAFACFLLLMVVAAGKVLLLRCAFCRRYNWSLQEAVVVLSRRLD